MSSPETKTEPEGKAQQPEAGAKVEKPTKPPAKKNVQGIHGERKVGTKNATKPFVLDRSQPQSKEPATRYIIIVAVSLVIGGAYAFYKSPATRQPRHTPIEIEMSSEPAPPLVEQPISKTVTPAPKQVVRQSLHSNAIINVPTVGLRKSHDIDAKPIPGTLKRGESVEIVERHSSRGPAWVKIKTKSGKVGWVFASVVKGRKGG